MTPFDFKITGNATVERWADEAAMVVYLGDKRYRSPGLQTSTQRRDRRGADLP
ncbi:hypothetical protein [Mesorhizobium sp. B2-3-11]|uniref:hypothetical protein n=1 Tax=Mesorhizobium sp. B2-3-11 TaxID=2589953 RepID=UPI0015E3678E|nr:hypothetical protein [Mesorhizobium sp. B2-3-11]